VEGDGQAGEGGGHCSAVLAAVSKGVREI
jgi:hypothetical protein